MTDLIMEHIHELPDVQQLVRQNLDSLPQLRDLVDVTYRTSRPRLKPLSVRGVVRLHCGRSRLTLLSVRGVVRLHCGRTRLERVSVRFGV